MNEDEKQIILDAIDTWGFRASFNGKISRHEDDAYHRGGYYSLCDLADELGIDYTPIPEF